MRRDCVEFALVLVRGAQAEKFCELHTWLSLDFALQIVSSLRQGQSQLWSSYATRSKYIQASMDSTGAAGGSFNLAI